MDTIVVVLYGYCEALRWYSADTMKYCKIPAWAGMRLYMDGWSGMDWVGIGWGWIKTEFETEQLGRCEGNLVGRIGKE